MRRGPHQARQLRRRLHADAHHETPERRQGVQPVGDDAAHRLNWQEARKQRAAQQIDAERAGQHVELAGAIVGAQHLVAAWIAAPRQRRTDAIGKRRHVAQAEIEALRADGRKDMACFADKSRARPDETFSVEARDREMRAGADLADAAEKPSSRSASAVSNPLASRRINPSISARLANPDHA